MIPAFLTPYFNDLTAFVASVALLAGYHIYVRIRIRLDPNYTVQAVHAVARAAWVESVMAEKRDILAVQTLRNSTMAATFLASTAVLLIMGALSLSEHGGDLEHALHSLNVHGTVDPSLWMTKLILIILDLCVAFFSFTLAVRKFNHVGYLLNVPKTFDHPVVNTRYVAALLNRAARHYSIGMRAYYFTMPLLFWLFTPILMLVSSIALVFLLHHLDRAQDAGD
jgi:uncharacterized membrane protein